ncbi:MAG: FtsX-like permease family protein [Eubacteriales bacterium]
MSFSLYPKLALGGMRKNARLYVPYLLTSAGMVMMTYILAFLAFSPLTTVATGTSGTAMILNLGIFVVAGFAALFLFYTNSFLIRRREREFGLYSVLGMGKFNLALILLFEALFTAAISLVAGLLGGMLFSKIAEVGLLRLIGADFTYKLTVSPSALVFTVTIYLIIFGLILLRSVSRVGFRSAADLTKSENVGEKPPKGNIFLGIAGVLLLGFAYWLAVTIKDPVAALTLFFFAVLMVIAATYMIFISGSVVFCRLLQKNKGYYYNKRHFVSVSSMVYRMKRNGAGLASICILATMVLVMISSTTCLYFGLEDSLRSIYPREINATAYFESLDDMSEEATDRLRAAAENTLTKEGYTGQNFLEWRRASCSASLNGMSVSTKGEDGQWIQLIFVPLSDYNTAMGTNETLSDGETLVYSYRTDFSGTA